MIKLKFRKALITCICIGMLTTGTAYAKESQSTPISNEQTISINQLTEWQKEIDTKLFESNRAEIEKQGFSVTHTSQTDNYVEIGITPYSEDNAKYIYGLLGVEQIKVVEGVQAKPVSAEDGIAYTTTGVNDVQATTANPEDSVVYTTTVVDDTQDVPVIAEDSIIYTTTVVDDTQATPESAEDGISYTTTAVKFKTPDTNGKSSVNTPIVFTASATLLLAGSFFLFKKIAPLKK